MNSPRPVATSVRPGLAGDAPLPATPQGWAPVASPAGLLTSATIRAEATTGLAHSAPLLRAAELVPGGRLVLDMMGRHEGGASTGGLLWGQILSVVEELTDEGRLDAATVDGYVFPVYERTLEEVRRPFDDALSARFEVEHLDVRDSEPPAWQRYPEDGDAEAFAFTVHVLSVVVVRTGA